MLKPIEFTVSVFGEGVFSLLEDHAEDFYGYYHRHDEVQITHILAGHGSILIGNNIQSFKPGETFIIKPNEPHLFKKSKSQGESTVIRAIHVFVNLRRMSPLFRLPEFDQISQFFDTLTDNRKLEQDITTQFQDTFLNLLETTHLPRFQEFITLLQQIVISQVRMISLLTGSNHVGYSEKDGERISKIHQFTFKNFEKNINISEAADLIHMSPTSFCKFFKKHTMKTYTEFLNEIRIENACQRLLNNKTETIAETAFEVGFGTIVHFNRMFKKVMKLSPSDFIRKHRLG